MSLSRAAHFTRPRIRLLSAAALRCRPASTTSHGHEHEHHDEPADVYTKEGFSGSIWWKTLAVSLLGVAAYKYAPERGEDVYLTRWMAMYMAPRDLWMRLNVKHTVMQAEYVEQSMILDEPRPPVVRRYRYPQLMDQSSPFIQRVGMSVSFDGVKVKTDKDD
ncbi:hypothetical protein HGRIS_002238 [Hohenbuehelia grisea]|uniref:Uncharacterized protein n=1 Tax=Hohenbuehelia grisea TaxID=104357 RepID=A0ABR3JJW5_9AGAR